MGTVTVDGNSYEVYGDLAGANLYVAGLLGSGAQAYRAYTDNEKQRLLLAARYMLDARYWQGTATFVGTTLQWPRVNVVDAYGHPVSSTVVPTGIVNGEYELAVALAADSSLYAIDGGAAVRSFRTGPESASFFRPATGGQLETTIFPAAVMRQVGVYLERPANRATSYQADGETNKGNFADSAFGGTQDDVLKRSRPF